jgi:hypothetical protein
LYQNRRKWRQKKRRTKAEVMENVARAGYSVWKINEQSRQKWRKLTEECKCHTGKEYQWKKKKKRRPPERASGFQLIRQPFKAPLPEYTAN